MPSLIRDTSEWETVRTLLPTHSDHEIANRTGITRELIRRERRRMGVTPFSRSLDGMKRCSLCKEAKPVLAFGTKVVKGHTLCLSRCIPCEVERKKSRVKPPLTPKQKQDANQRSKLQGRKVRVEQHKHPNLRAKILLVDTRKSDKGKGYTNDLTIEYITAEIQKGCHYCGCHFGDSECVITLDRVDNSKGHVQGNVNPACVLCNSTRSNMCYEAWILVAKGMQQARDAGLFNGWIRPKLGPKIKD